MGQANLEKHIRPTVILNGEEVFTCKNSLDQVVLSDLQVYYSRKV